MDEMIKEEKRNESSRCLRAVLHLAAPHTWAASIVPVLLGTMLRAALPGWDGSTAPTWGTAVAIFLLVLAAAILLQSSVNAINDYCDFVRGLDRLENSDDPNDAVLVYGNLSPERARLLGFAFLGAALLCGILPVLRGGLSTLALGAVGCLVVIAYSAGKWPLCNYPLGELVSGIAMGALLTAAAYSAFGGGVPPTVFLYSLPCVLGIAFIMMTNNLCDMDRDKVAGRRTLPLLLGHAKAMVVYRCGLCAWIGAIFVLVAAGFTGGLPRSAVLLAFALPYLATQLQAKPCPETRRRCMQGIVRLNFLLGAVYLAGVSGELF
ncbi:MAG: prenyltransferase [Clostridiales Family XIII bacterium]|jgi:1,4-dihydroxy-2-naphthoate octaprenyltransferase|nr:prenyltransferase [Clostridiales Family XIII bacterium]